MVTETQMEHISCSRTAVVVTSSEPALTVDMEREQINAIAFLNAKAQQPRPECMKIKDRPSHYLATRLS